MKKQNSSKSGKKLAKTNKRRQEAIDRIHKNVIDYTAEVDTISKSKKLKQEDKDAKIAGLTSKINKAKQVIEFTERNLIHRNQY